MPMVWTPIPMSQQIPTPHTIPMPSPTPIPPPTSMRPPIIIHLPALILPTTTMPPTAPMPLTALMPQTTSMLPTASTVPSSMLIPQPPATQQDAHWKDSKWLQHCHHNPQVKHFSVYAFFYIASKILREGMTLTTKMKVHSAICVLHFCALHISLSHFFHYIALMI